MRLNTTKKYFYFVYYYHNQRMEFIKILFFKTYTIILINWNLLINEKITYSHWIIGGIYSRSIQGLFVQISTTVIYLYPMTQILLNKNQVNYWKLLISNLTQLFLTILILICEWCRWIGLWFLLRATFLLLAGCLISLLIHTVIIENNRSRIFLLSMGGAVLLIAFISHPLGLQVTGLRWYGAIGYIFALGEYLKLCINVIGTFVIIKKKFKLA